MFKKLRRDSFGDGWAKISRMEWAPWSKQDILSTHSTLLSPWHDTWVCTIWREAKATILVEAFHFSEPKRLVERQSGFYWFWECEKKGLKLVPVSSSWTQISTGQTKNVWHFNPWNEAVICSVFYLGSRSGSRSMMYNVSSDMANALLLRCGQPAGKLGFGTTNGYLSVDRQWSSDRPPKSSALTGGGATGTHSTYPDQNCWLIKRLIQKLPKKPVCHLIGYSGGPPRRGFSIAHASGAASGYRMRLTTWSHKSTHPNLVVESQIHGEVRSFSTFASGSFGTFSPLAARVKTLAFLHSTRPKNPAHCFVQNLWVWTIGSVLGRSRFVIRFSF